MEPVHILQLQNGARIKFLHARIYTCTERDVKLDFLLKEESFSFVYTDLESLYCATWSLLFNKHAWVWTRSNLCCRHWATLNRVLNCTFKNPIK